MGNAYGPTTTIQLSRQGDYAISVYGISDCAESVPPLYIIVYSTASSQSSSYSYTAYPNPANDLLNVEIGEGESAQSAFAPATIGIEATDAPLLITYDKQSKVTDSVFDIRLYNEMGVQLRQTTAKKGGKVQFNLSNLPNGNYYLHIYDGVNDKPEMRQIVIKH